jgi:N-carbamoyl-L-amino-acid hydrolase
MLKSNGERLWASLMAMAEVGATARAAAAAWP